MEGTLASCTVQRMVTVHLFCHGLSLGKGNGTGSCAPSFICMTSCKFVLLLFSAGEGCFALSMHPEEYPPQKD